MQCHGSTGYCWCVHTQTNQEQAGTRQFGQPNCGAVQNDGWFAENNGSFHIFERFTRFEEITIHGLARYRYYITNMLDCGRFCSHE